MIIKDTRHKWWCNVVSQQVKRWMTITSPMLRVWASQLDDDHYCHYVGINWEQWCCTVYSVKCTVTGAVLYRASQVGAHLRCKMIPSNWNYPHYIHIHTYVNCIYVVKPSVVCRMGVCGGLCCVDIWLYCTVQYSTVQPQDAGLASGHSRVAGLALHTASLGINILHYTTLLYVMSTPW